QDFGIAFETKTQLRKEPRSNKASNLPLGLCLKDSTCAVGFSLSQVAHKCGQYALMKVMVQIHREIIGADGLRLYNPDRPILVANHFGRRACEPTIGQCFWHVSTPNNFDLCQRGRECLSLLPVVSRRP